MWRPGISAEAVLAVLLMLWGCGSGSAEPTPPTVLEDAAQDVSLEASAEAETSLAEEGVEADAGAEEEPGAPVTTCGKLTTPDDNCAACLDKNCCSGLEACAKVPACVSLVECGLACGTDEECLNGCVAQTKDESGTADALMACEGKLCSAECHVAGGKCGSRLTDPTCGDCSTEKCCDLQYAEATTPDFWVFQECALACPAGDDACGSACVVSHQQGYAASRRFEACLSIYCGTECQIDSPCGLSLSTLPCDTCAEQKCCQSLREAAENLGFWTYSACTTPCSPTDPACFVACGKAQEEGFALDRLVGNCLAESCGKECKSNFPCGIYAPGSAGCVECVEQQCCEKAKEAAESAETWKYQLCIEGCLPECKTDCIRKHPGAASLGWAAYSCWAVHCKQECLTPAEQADFHCGWLTWASGEACDACQDASCCDRVTEAAEHLSFWQYVECSLTICDSSDTACKEKCGTSNPEGWALHLWVVSCMGTSCAQDCSIITAATCGAPIDPSATECRDCVASKCCAEVGACWSDLECLKYSTCYVSHECSTDPACAATCAAQTPTGAAKDEAANSCLDQNCKSECGR